MERRNRRARVDRKKPIDRVNQRTLEAEVIRPDRGPFPKTRYSTALGERLSDKWALQDLNL